MKFQIIREASEALGWNRQEVIDGLRSGDIEIKEYNEALNLATDYIEESLWAFNPDFISHYVRQDGITGEMIRDAIGDRCEDANEFVKSLVGDNLTILADDAIGCDGLGHFLSSYDGNAHEILNAKYVVWRT